MKKNTDNTTSKEQSGFTGIPHSVLDGLVLMGLSKREMVLSLLVARLTYGCHRQWAALKQADLVVIGVSASHAKEVISTATANGALVQNGKTGEYKLGELYVGETANSQRLRKLIGKHIAPSASQNSNPKVTEQVTDNLPKKEDATSQNGNPNDFPKRELSRSDKGIVPQPKDSDKDKYKETDKDSPIANKKYPNPNTFKPNNAAQEAALYAWKTLEPNQPDSFSVYLKFVKNGLSSDIIYRITSEIKQDPTVRNKGALFNTKAYEYLRRLLTDKVGVNV